MKTNQPSFHFFAVILLAGVFHLQAADLTNTTAVVQESWQTISNRWGSLPLEKIKQAAETNEVTAQYFLGCAYAEGNGVATNLTESFKWVKLAAQAGLAIAQRYLGWKYEHGMGIETNTAEAFGWYKKAAQQGDAKAQFNLGWMYDSGVYVPQDFAEAARLYRLAAEQGHAMAQNNLGYCYYRGAGVPFDPVEAVKWYAKSAEQSEPYGEKNLAWIYAKGAYGPTNHFGQGSEAQIRSGGVAPNHELAEKWMRKAVDLNSPVGQYQLGDLLYNEVDYAGHEDATRFPEAAEWFKKSADQGYDKAQFQLANMYHYGKLGDSQRTNAIQWFMKAAAQGNVEAQAKLGELGRYYPNSGLSKTVDPVEALRRAADSENPSAQFQLAKRYQNGNGVPKDASESFKWMEKAAQNGMDEAVYDLALMYEKGVGVKADLSVARSYMIQASISEIPPSLEGGWPDACFRVGQWYEIGDGVSQDDYRAIKYYWNAVNNLNGRRFKSQAAESLLKLYADGRGLSKTNQEPADYIDRELADKPAMIQEMQREMTTAQAELSVGRICYQGILVRKNLVEAAARFQVAAEAGSGEAQKMLVELEPDISANQKEAARKLAGELKTKLYQQRSLQQALINLYGW